MKFTLYDADSKPKIKAYGWFLAFIIITGSLLIEAWLSMLFLGVAHAADERVPALGLATCIPLVVALSTPVAFVNYWRTVTS